MNNDVQLQVLIEKSIQLNITHINTRSMISTFGGLLLTLTQDTFDERKKKPLSGRIIKVRKKFNIVWQSYYFSRYKIPWPQELQNDKLV